MQPHPELGVC